MLFIILKELDSSYFQKWESFLWKQSQSIFAHNVLLSLRGSMIFNLIDTLNSYVSESNENNNIEAELSILCAIESKFIKNSKRKINIGK